MQHYYYTMKQYFKHIICTTIMFAPSFKENVFLANITLRN